ncbi:universal stress protein [Halobacteria archaeon AArc-curdl1]|uniref:Universal stress protein n=1 Tax=Natronosalvus hydrolyticus TaxID=2979988 RepID=A0AAP2ZA62_9EURY|nr:universal stress protein [Halobacteria archaeon AArc-curdl1]
MNILVPFDIQPVSERAVRATLELFGDREDVHVVATHISDAKADPARIAANEIESLGDNYEASVEAEVRLIEGDPSSKAVIRKAITDIVESEEIDLVILGYESKSLFDRVLESDTTERLLQNHEIPVLLVP